jgi:serine/threonine protein kinase
LQQNSDGHDKNYVVQLLDDFRIDGANGCHQALVFEMLGPSVDLDIDDAEFEMERMEDEDILKISTKLLQALEFLHKAGHGHGGKIKNSFHV